MCHSPRAKLAPPLLLSPRGRQRGAGQRLMDKYITAKQEAWQAGKGGQVAKERERERLGGWSCLSLATKTI